MRENYEKALNSLKRDNYDYAIELLTGIIAINQEFAEARHFLRVAQRKKYIGAPPSKLSEAISNIISIGYFIKALIFKLRNEPSLAILEYEKILANNPFSIWALLEQGKTFLYMELRDSAIYCFEEIYAVEQNNMTALKNLGKLYIDKGDYDRARASYKKLMEVHPHDHDAEKGLRNLDALGAIKKNYSETQTPNDFKNEI